jgi:DNA gyrase/topoisomerase IV subunit B
MSQTPDYNGREIKILLPPEAVRTRPTMYIGSTDHLGLHVLLQFTVRVCFPITPSLDNHLTR